MREKYIEQLVFLFSQIKLIKKHFSRYFVFEKRLSWSTFSFSSEIIRKKKKSQQQEENEEINRYNLVHSLSRALVINREKKKNDS